MYIDTYGNSSASRKEIQEIAYSIFNNDYKDLVIMLLNSRYKPEIVNESLARYVYPTKNPLRRIALAQSVLYTRPPRLQTTPEWVAEEIGKYCPDMYLYMSQLQALCLGVGDALAWPYFDTAEKNIKIQIVPPHLVDVHYRLMGQAAIRVRIGDQKWRIWTTDFWFDSDEDPEKWWIPKKNQKTTKLYYGIPLVLFQSKKPYIITKDDDAWNVFDNIDLINGTLQVGEAETLHNKGLWLRSFRQVSADTSRADTGAEPKNNELKIAPDTVLNFPLNSTALADEAGQFYKAIREIEVDLAASRGISTKSYYRDIVNETEIMSVSEELRQRWYGQVSIFNYYEIKLLKVIANLLNKDVKGMNIPADTEYSINYVMPANFTSKMKQLEELEKGIELLETSIEEFLYVNNPEFRNMEEVKKYLEENKESRIEVITTLRELNEARNPAYPGNSPEANGAMGPVFRGEKEKEMSGANGPKIVPTAYDADAIARKKSIKEEQ